MAFTVFALLLSGACSQGLRQLRGRRYARTAYACTFVRARSFTLVSVCGVVALAPFFSDFLPLLPLPVALLSRVFFHWTSSLSVTGARAGAGFGGRGSLSVAGRAGLWGVLPGFRLAVPAPKPLGTQPPFAT